MLCTQALLPLSLQKVVLFMKDVLDVTLIWIFQPSYQHEDKKAKPKDQNLIKATWKKKKKSNIKISSLL